MVQGVGGTGQSNPIFDQQKIPKSSDKSLKLPSGSEIKQKLESKYSKENLGKALRSAENVAGHTLIFLGTFLGSNFGGDNLVRGGMNARGKEGDSAKGIASHRQQEKSRLIRLELWNIPKTFGHALNAVAKNSDAAKNVPSYSASVIKPERKRVRGLGDRIIKHAEDRQDALNKKMTAAMMKRAEYLDQRNSTENESKSVEEDPATLSERVKAMGREIGEAVKNAARRMFNRNNDIEKYLFTSDFFEEIYEQEDKDNDKITSNISAAYQNLERWNSYDGIGNEYSIPLAEAVDKLTEEIKTLSTLYPERAKDYSDQLNHVLGESEVNEDMAETVIKTVESLSEQITNEISRFHRTE